MVRKRLLQPSSRNNDDGRGRPSAINTNAAISSNRNAFTYLIMFATISFMAVRFGLYWNGREDANSVTRFANLPSAGTPYDEKIWGTYRPHLYFGLRNRHPESPLFGLIWYKQPKRRFIESLPMRHWCDHGDNVKFMWEDCDGKSFGHQTLKDEGVVFDTDWFNHQSGQNSRTDAHSWSARVNLRKSANQSVAFVFYLALQDTKTKLETLTRWEDAGNYQILRGVSPTFGRFSLSLRLLDDAGTSKISEISYTALQMAPQVDATQINEILLRSLRRSSESAESVELQLMNNEASDPPNFVAVQITLRGASKIEIHYGAQSEVLDGSFSFDAEYEKCLANFRGNFVKAFPISAESNETKKLQKLGKTALSNLLGGIGFWHGHSIVRSELFPGERPYGPLSLFSAVPSRPFFPRGFIWDEGFHNLLIAKFDPVLSLQIISSWLDTMNEAGWIPREMILGVEAQAKVPAEFLVQSDAVANPPVFFYLIEKFLKDREFMARHGAELRRLYPRMKHWYIWLRRTQSGPRKGTFRWRGRNSTTIYELNPKTLPSGLDDFPRSSHPSDEEYHLDLRCWMAVASRVLRMLSEQSDDTEFTPVVEEDVRVLNDPALLDQLHWSDRVQRYCDYGRHSQSVRLVRKSRKVGDDPPRFVNEWTRDVSEPPKLGLVEDVNGYVGLFPFLLKLIPAESPKLEIILKGLNRTEELWSPHGLRSISQKSPYYMARNTEHDAPYWRGAIWININYLALDALAHYARESIGAPISVRELCRSLHSSLRENLLRTIGAEFSRTGFLWENYNDVTGRGQGTRPFTGWTALILNIIADSDL